RPRRPVRSQLHPDLRGAEQGMSLVSSGRGTAAVTAAPAGLTGRPAPPTPEGLPVASAPRGTRGRRQGALLRLRGDVPPGLVLGLGVLGVVVLLGGWTLVSTAMGSDSFLL